MGTSGNGDCQLASRSVLKDFTKDALTVAVGSLFQNGTARMVKANWRPRVQHRFVFSLAGRGDRAFGVLALSVTLAPSGKGLSGSPRRGCNLDPVTTIGDPADPVIGSMKTGP